MQTCQKIVRVQNGLITEIYDGLRYRHFQDNESAFKELLMDDLGLDFQAMLQTYERLILELAEAFPDLTGFLSERLPEDWLDWMKPTVKEVTDAVIGNTAPSRL